MSSVAERIKALFATPPYKVFVLKMGVGLAAATRDDPDPELAANNYVLPTYEHVSADLEELRNQFIRDFDRVVLSALDGQRDFDAIETFIANRENQAECRDFLLRLDPVRYKVPSQPT